MDVSASPLRVVADRRPAAVLQLVTVAQPAFDPLLAAVEVGPNCCEVPSRLLRRGVRPRLGYPARRSAAAAAAVLRAVPSHDERAARDRRHGPPAAVSPRSELSLGHVELVR